MASNETGWPTGEQHARFREHLNEVSAIVATWEPWERHILSSAECGVDKCPCHNRAALNPDLPKETQ